MIENILLKIVQLTAISTFCIWFLFIFLPKFFLKKNYIKNNFFSKESFVHTFVLTSQYIFSLGYLFLFNAQTFFKIAFYLGFIFSIYGLLVAFIARFQMRTLWNPVTNAYNSRQIYSKGIYKFLRHPIYEGRFFFFLGIVLMQNIWAIFLAPFYWDYLRNRAIAEERYLLSLNKNYKDYKRVAKGGIFFI